ncbi:hypothetical protein [Singulisphaera sp. PoT]|uniref:hypothetical protein n=1 Tax=Singulisphaera sp. PoT TaxID=3411797 RepID=UPI003BF4D055
MGRPVKRPWQREGDDQWYGTIHGRKGVKLGNPESIQTYRQAEAELFRRRGQPSPRKRKRCADENIRGSGLPFHEYQKFVEEHGGMIAVTAIKDLYHDLIVECSEKEVERECDSCRLAAPLRVLIERDLRAGACDCSLDDWLELFRDDVHAAEKRGWPGKPDPTYLLTPALRKLALAAERAEGPVQIDSDSRIAPYRGKWVLLDSKGEMLDDLEMPNHCDPESKHCEPILFKDARTAIAARVLIRTMCEGRELRYKVALRKLDGSLKA